MTDCKKTEEIYWFDSQKEALDFAKKSGRDWYFKIGQCPTRTGIVFI